MGLTMNSNWSVIAYGIASALTWGAGDFGGGLATKRSNVYSVIIVSQFAGAGLLLTLTLLFADAIPPAGDLLLGALAGIFGTLGLVPLYRGLAEGRMGLVSPVAAVVTAALPVLVGLLLEGLPGTTQLAGFAIALGAVWLLSHQPDGGKVHLGDLVLPVSAGIGFGLFFILIDRASTDGALWPLVAARLASISMQVLIATVRRQRVLPARNQVPLIILAGLLDMGGNTFFVLATRAGRLDTATILSSLYPAVTVLLAWFVLKERLRAVQWIGVLAALLALVLIAV